MQTRLSIVGEIETEVHYSQHTSFGRIHNG